MPQALLLALLLHLPQCSLDARQGTLGKPASAGALQDSTVLACGMACLLRQFSPACAEVRGLFSCC